MNRLLPLLLIATPAFAAPTPAPLPPPLPTPHDKPYPGQIELSVDATNIEQHIVQIAETIPIPPDGQLTLLYPKWLPGNHGPTGPLPSLAGLTVTAGGQPVTWQRDPVDMGAFHVAVPPGAPSVQVRFQFLSPLDNKDARVVMTANMVEVEWRPEILFPAGYYQRDIPVHAAVRLPAGFQYATALTAEPPSGGQAADRGQTPESAGVTFRTVPLETLLDSPVLAGRYFSRIDLDPGAAVPVHMDLVADRPIDLAIKPEDLQAHRNLVQQAYRAFGSHHYDHYDFLFSVSEEMGNIGLEHQRSCEVGAHETYFTAPDKSAPGRDLLPHEFTHS